MADFDYRKLDISSRARLALEMLLSWLGRGGKVVDANAFLTTLSDILAHCQLPEGDAERLMELAKELPSGEFEFFRIFGELIVKRIPRSMGTKKLTSKPYLIWKEGKPLFEGVKKDVQRFREDAVKHHFDIFANDADPGELLVIGEPSNLRVGETIAWSTLTALLERVGSRWTTKELCGKVRPDVEYKRRYSELIYQSVRHVKEVLCDDIEKAGLRDPKKLVDSWFQTKHPNRIEVSRKLRAVLIRENPWSRIR